MSSCIVATGHEWGTEGRLCTQPAHQEEVQSMSHCVCMCRYIIINRKCKNEKCKNEKGKCEFTNIRTI